MFRKTFIDRYGPASDAIVTEDEKNPRPNDFESDLDVIHIDGIVELAQMANAILAEFTVSRRSAGHDELIAEAKALDKAATPGPWDYNIGQGIVAEFSQSSEDAMDNPVATGRTDEDAAFIARARTLVPELVAALEAVTK